MPIRFRCVYCNQLLGISRRKAGSIVRCTKCEGQLIVPEPVAAATEMTGDAGAIEAPPIKTDPGEVGGLFERDDFDAILEPYQNPAASGAAIAPPPVQRERRAAVAPSPAPTPAEIIVTRRQLMIASAATVLGLGMSFAVGLWIGLSMR